jgi:2-hydroxy-3-keto-5-methylthiopentenyl-1-phosphate phosphatase
MIYLLPLTLNLGQGCFNKNGYIFIIKQDICIRFVVKNSFANGTCNDVKKCDQKIKVKVKLKTKIGKSKYSVLVACRMSNAVNKASYLAIFCGNALSSCTKVADLLILNDMVEKCRKSTKNWRSYDKFCDHLLETLR